MIVGESFLAWCTAATIVLGGFWKVICIARNHAILEHRVSILEEEIRKSRVDLDHLEEKITVQLQRIEQKLDTFILNRLGE